MVLVVKSPPTNAGDARDTGSIPGLGRSPGGGNGNLLQFSCLKTPMDKGAWWELQRVGHGRANERTNMRAAFQCGVHACVLVSAAAFQCGVHARVLVSASLLLFNHQVVSDSLRPEGLQHTRLPCPSPSPGVCSNSVSNSNY